MHGCPFILAVEENLFALLSRGDLVVRESANQRVDLGDRKGIV
jgi:hypothetical protein